MYTALVAEDNKPTRTVELMVDTHEPTVMIDEVGNGIVDVEMTLPAATYKEDRNEGGITEYKLWYLGADGASDPEDVTANIESTDPQATLKNGGTFTPNAAGTYKIVAKGSKDGGVDEATGEREFKVMAVDEHKPYNFFDELITGFLKDDLTSIVAVTNDMATEAPDGAPAKDTKVLQTTWTNTATAKEVGKISALPLKVALSRLATVPTNLEESILSYWVYNAGAEAINAAYNFVDADGTKVALEERAVPAGKWMKYEISLLKLCGPNGFKCEVDDLANKLGTTGYLAFSVSGTGTLYTSDITIEQADAYNIAENTLVDFGYDLTKYLLLYGNAQEVSVVEASGVSGEITAPSTNGDNKVLKIVGKTTDSGQELGGIDGAIIMAALNKYSYNLADKFITFKYYVSGPADSDIRVGMRWYNGTTQKDLNTPDLYIGIWKEAKFSIGEIGAPDTLKDEIDKLMFVPQVDSTDDITVYVSNIYIEGNTTPDINEYDPAEGKMVDFNQTAIKNFIQVGGAKTVDVVDPTSRPGTKPFDGDANVLKIEGSTFTASKTRDLGYIDGAVVKKALEEYSGDLAGKYIRFKYYVTADASTSVQISMRWWKNSTSDIDLSLGTITTGTWNIVEWKMDDVADDDVEVELDELKNNIDHLSFCTTTGTGSNITLYVSSIYLYDPLAEYEADGSKLVDFGQESIEYFFVDNGEATVSLADSTIERAGGQEINQPYADKEYDKTVLKVESTDDTDWRERGVIDGAIIRKVLTQVGNDNIANKLVRFKYYVDPACTSQDIRINLRWVLTDGSAGSVECKLRPGKWTEFSFVIRDFDPVVGTSNGFDDKTVDDLVNLTDYLSFYVHTGNSQSNITFYVSNIYIEEATYLADEDSIKTTPYDFSQPGIEDFARGDDYTATSIVDASTVGASSTPEGAPKDGDKVLKIDWVDNPNRTDNFATHRVLDTEPLRRALRALTDEELSNASITYWIYNDSDITYGAKLRFCRTSSAETDNKEVRRGDSTDVNSKVWTMVGYKLSDLLGSDGYNCSREELASILDYLALFPNHSNVGEGITLYISNINIDIYKAEKNNKLVDFGQNAIAGFLSHGSHVSSTEVVTVGGDSDEVTSLPYSAKKADNKALKITFSGTSWQDTKQLISTTIFQQALAKYSAEELEKGTIKFKVYCAGATGGGLTINICNKDNTKWAAGTDGASRGDNVRFTRQTSTMTGNAWTEYAIPIAAGDSWVNGGSTTTILGGASGTWANTDDEKNKYNNSFGDGMTAAQLAENFGSIGLYYNNANNNILYLSDIYLDIPVKYEAQKGKLVNFQSDGVMQYIRKETATDIELVDSAIEKNYTGTVIGSPYTEGAHVGDTQVLKIEVPKGAGTYAERISILADVIKVGFAQYNDGELNENAKITLKMYVTGQGVTHKYDALRVWWGTGSNDRFNGFSEKGAADAWIEHSLTLKTIMDNANFSSTIGEMVDEIVRFTFTGPIQAGSGNNVNDRPFTIFVSDIYLEPAAA